jgi:hypothetical protein
MNCPADDGLLRWLAITVSKLVVRGRLKIDACSTPAKSRAAPA